MPSTTKSYTQAFISAVSSKEATTLNTAIAELDLFLNVARQSRLFGFLAGRLIPSSDKLAILEKISRELQLGKEAQSLLYVLTPRKHISWLPVILRQLKEARRKLFNVEEGEVISCAALSAEDKARARKILEKISGHKILITEKENPRIIGGLVLRCGDTVLDSSILHKIKTLKKLLTA